MLSMYHRFAKRMREEEDGITALETAIILIAFVVVASVFAFTMLSAGSFSTERGKEAIYAGLTEVQSSIELKGSMIAEATTTGVSGTVDSLVFTLSNTAGGLPINIENEGAPQLAFEYRDSEQRVTIDNDAVTVKFINEINANGMLEYGELAEITVDLTAVNDPALGTSTNFVLEIKPPSGAVVSLQRTTPAWLEKVNDLK